MYAVIKTGGKQYRVQAGDLLVVEKLQGEPGDEVRFDQVLMVGDDAGATIGAPTVEGATVTATMIETRKGEKVKIFKKIRRQGYRRTKGHRQPESVLRVISLAAGGKKDAWDGTVDLTPRATLVARARGLAGPSPSALKAAGIEVEAVVEDVEGPVVHAAVVEHADTAEAPAPKKARAKKAEPTETTVEAAAEAAPEAAPEAEAAPKKTRAKKKTDDAEGGEA